MPSWPSLSNPLNVGTLAPDFKLSEEGGKIMTLSKLRGHNVILVFYPGDDTNLCTKQLCALRDHWGQLQERNTLAFGVNPRGHQSHEKFRNTYNFPFPLLVDTGQKVARLYQAGGLVVKRTVYLIGPDGTIRFAMRGNPSPEEVLKAAV